MEVGKNIKQIRELKNLTQGYIAERLNMSIGGYSKIESGQTDVTLSKIQQIAEILETDLSTILSFDPKNIFNQCNNNNSIITGSIGTQNNNGNIIDILSHIQEEIISVKRKIEKEK
ncbi:MAG: helix-turn-helix transcriptional regulator [Flavobacteriales bacterium]|nr:helix-turn-helix transcriptional regulator [Flavobacteriales bacterium]MCL4856977.1 helix-turn-helix domain-containing protein [Flavobacteriales bacterium]